MHMYTQTHIYVALLIHEEDSPNCFGPFTSGFEGQNQLEKTLQLTISQGTLKVTAFSLADLGMRMHLSGTVQSKVLGSVSTISI